MDKHELKQKVLEAIDRHKDEIIEIGETIFANPELGYKEYKTAQLVKDVFDRYGVKYRSEIARTGVIGELTGTQNDITVAVLGELDAVLCYDHPSADKETGAVHACGHNAMIASLLGVTIGLVESDAMQHLAGRVKLIAVPAEEFVELEYRQKLQEEGEIEFLGGKQELIRLGEFDDVDLAMMIHPNSDSPAQSVFVGGSSNGFIGKTVRYIGKEAHAGGAPFEGINALNAAMLGLMGIHANRETFRDSDTIRVHPIITKGGDLVNIVPADVRMETYVRGSNLEAIIDANRKVNNALRAGALAVGAEVEITEIPGYLPMKQNERMTELFRQNAIGVVGEDNVHQAQSMGGSTDMGDVSHIMPAIHPYTGGVAGTAHTRTYSIADVEAAYIVPTKCLALTLVDLLFDDASEAKEIKAKYKPEMTIPEYLKMWRDLTSTK